MKMPEQMRSPDQVREVIREIESNAILNVGLDAMMTRADECKSALCAKLIGIGMHNPSRLHFEKHLDRWWASNTLPSTDKGPVEEIVVGSGLHAAIYCAIRARLGAPKPIVLERSAIAGGTFAFSREPSFFLNSRNRPGELGTPGQGEALNYIPGAIVQPADLSNDEYQRNTTLAYVIRATLAMFARVITSAEVEGWTNGGPENLFVQTSKGEIRTKRLIIAAGLGTPRRITPSNIVNKGGLIDYPTFLRRFDEPFPLRGLNKVAVIGSGDSGRTTIEALLGQGPSLSMSPGSMDYPERIDWYGIKEEESTREGFERCNRSRYSGIARALPRENNIQSALQARVVPVNRRPEYYELTYDGAIVDGAFYDAAILSIGFLRDSLVGRIPLEDREVFKIDGREVGRKVYNRPVFYIGPCSELDEQFRANIPADVPENTVALFRYADRTASLAMFFDVQKKRTFYRQSPNPFMGRERATVLENLTEEQKRKLLGVTVSFSPRPEDLVGSGV